MNKFLLILLFIFTSVASCAQNIVPRTNDSFTTQDSRWAALYNMFAPRYADTTAANARIGIDSCGAIIFTYDVMGLWYRACSPKRWVVLLPTASEGLTSVNWDIRLFGTIASPAVLTTERALMINRNSVQFTNGTTPEAGGPIWQHTDRPFSPIIINTRDTLTANNIDPPSAAMPLSSIFARRTLYYADGIFTTQKIYGHYFSQTINFLDSMRFRTEGGDYNQAVTIEQRIQPRGIGPQRTGHNGAVSNTLPYYGVPALLVNTILENNPGINTIHTYGWLTGISSYLVASALDTVERFSFFQTNNFLNAGTRVKKYFGIDFQHNLSAPVVDSAWGVWDEYGYRHWFRGNTVVGPKTDSSVTGYSLKVSGSMYMNGLLQGRQGTDVASTAGVMTLGPDGNVFEITGTNTITAISNTNKKNGYVVTLLFTSTATLTDGTANSGTSIGMELAGNTNFTGSAGAAVTLCLSEIGGTQRYREIGRSVN